MERRTFVKTGVLGALGSLALGCDRQPSELAQNRPPGSSRTQAPVRSPARSQVALVRNDAVVATLRPDAERVREMVHRGLVSLTGADSPAAAWRDIFSPSDVVGLKVNCLAGPGLSSSVAVTEAVVAGLRLADVPYRNIIVWERRSDELADAGFTLNRSSRSRYLCFGTDAVGLTEEIHSSGSVGSLLSRIVTDRITALINVPILKDHDLSGVGIGMKNLFGCIHNPNRYHGNGCDPFVAEVSNMEPIRQKLRLVVCDALHPQCHGGPALVRAHQWPYGGVLLSRDPVALDAVGARIIEDQRASRGLQSLTEAGRPPRWLDSAHELGLGLADLDRVQVLEVSS